MFILITSVLLAGKESQTTVRNYLLGEDNSVCVFAYSIIVDSLKTHHYKNHCI